MTKLGIALVELYQMEQYSIRILCSQQKKIDISMRIDGGLWRNKTVAMP